MTDNPWVGRRLFHWAHRGGGRENPSNSMRAMKHAFERGANGLELDVHATADDPPVVVVAHDDSLEMMTGDPGTIRDSTLAKLQRLDVGFNWVPGKIASSSLRWGDQWQLRGQGPNDHDLRIPTLDEVFTAFPDVPMNLEIKSAEVAIPLAEALERTGRRDVIVVSFRDWWLRRFRKRAPTVHTAASGLELLAFWVCSRVGVALRLSSCVALQAPLRYGPFHVCDARFVRAAHKRNLAVHVWTVDDPDAMHTAIDIGVDGIMTDRPSVLARVLEERPVGWTRT